MKRIFVAAVFGITTLFLCSSAYAIAAIVTVDDPKPDLTTATSGWTVDVGLTNVTTQTVSIAAHPTGKTATTCAVSPNEPTLAAATHVTVTFTVTSDCSVANGFSFSIAATQGGTTQTIGIGAGKPTSTATDWDPLLVFPISLGVLVIAALIAGFITGKNIGGGAGGAFVKLKYLDSTWSFSDSWVNTITAGAGILTGVFGSTDVAKALLEKDPGNTLDVAIVGAAIAVAMIAVAPIVLGAFRCWKSGDNTIVGLFLAAAFTLSGATGELWVMGQTATHLSVGWLHSEAPYISGALCVLLLVYAVQSLGQIVDTGVTEAPPTPTSDTLKGARLIAAAIRRSDSRSITQPGGPEGERVAMDLSKLVSTDDSAQAEVNTAINRDVPRRRRSALL